MFAVRTDTKKTNGALQQRTGRGGTRYQQPFEPLEAEASFACALVEIDPRHALVPEICFWHGALHSAHAPAILRLIYTFEAIWKACQQLLAEREGIEVASPNATIRAARRLGWLSDEDAQAAIVIGRDCNLAVHMYRSEIGAEIAARLLAHAALLRRWLEAIHQAAVTR